MTKGFALYLHVSRTLPHTDATIVPCYWFHEIYKAFFGGIFGIIEVIVIKSLLLLFL